MEFTNCIEDEIISIEYIGYEDTMDIEVNGNHLFFANNILTHNSAAERSIYELHEGTLADSWKKMMIADTVIALGHTPEERAQGRLFMKTIKNRNGPKDIVMPMNVVYEQLKIIDPKNQTAQALNLRAKQIINEGKMNKEEKKDETNN